MNELVKVLSRFIARDLVFILGGSTVIASVAYGGDWFSVGDEFFQAPSAVYSFLAVGAAYVVGYVAQEVLALTPILTMADYFEPNGFVRWLYRRFERQEWQPISRFDTYEADSAIRSRESASLGFFERILSLRQLGATMGSCLLVSSVPLFVRAWRFSENHLFVFAAVVLLVGGVLICLSWLKAAQQIRYMKVLHTQAGQAGQYGK